MLAFAVEGLIISGAALAIGPFLGMALAQALGTSNGFLEFVQRSSMNVHLNSKAYAYGGIAAAVSFGMMLIPVLLATRTSIVGHKQQLARMTKTPLWHKMFLDVLLLGVSIYGLYEFRSRLKDVTSLGLNADDLQIGSLQFVIPALFIVGSGLLLLRLYPYLLSLIYYIGRKWWAPAWYATLIQVGRSIAQYQFLMVFLIITIATGVFSAGAARTINNNIEERIRYAAGADISLNSVWQSDATPISASSGPTMAFAQTKTTETASAIKIIHYLEPPFDPYRNLPGVEEAAKVFVNDSATFTAGESKGFAKLIGIDTYDFGMTSWFKDYLNGYPLYEYMNLMAADPRAVLISRTLADTMKVKQGDTILVGWNEVNEKPFVVYGIVDYFPTFNPNPPLGSVSAADPNAKDGKPMLIVGHLSRIQMQLALEPYQVWLKMKPGFSTTQLYEGIEKSKLSVIDIVNSKENLVLAKRDPFLMALNGILTLGFLISIIITFFGFLLYWMLSLKGRTLQNGIMRAIGLSLRQLLGMLALEQLLTSGVAIMIGAIVGNVTGRLFVPNFQIAFNPSTLVPPFRVVFAQIDFVRLYIIVGIMLLLGLGILGYMLSRIRIHQALKLGED
ncbi:ABC transporter permease [Cohnella faecalis]|uniref:ABC transporter permease n=1 Tax=Cohnella faecalis TaxID=2315694 RepID=A0A398CIG5_9BACL|nr:FtsX-like permease family protein [Cohnella faecalis]RIE02533.1 ABC transporter permease [Cohnella faecalis]